ncbi:CLUMA_CG018893, isoform A [Clunio marinus]|uniref:CLUMA_CG018893, isoform A n=1 Tax=Clunio marinus TaxID=568069 RepID=A0A1J1J0J8_9DIPT|nr:CLUMA_CG018893, isoform A [Clunio marinus]
MNKFASYLIKPSFQKCVIRANPLNTINRVAFFSTEPPAKVPLSKNPKHKTSPRVTLISGENNIEIVTLDQAKKIADRRQLKLVSIVDYDTKTSRPIYKLMTAAEYLSEELKRRNDKKQQRNEIHIKSEKLLTIATKISEHDLHSKIAMCCKWIGKFHEVRVVISGDPSELQKGETIAKAIEDGVAPVEGRILQKRAKNGDVRFSILPTIKKEPNENVKETPGKAAQSINTEKNLLNPDTSFNNVQQIKSYHTMAF